MIVPPRINEHCQHHIGCKSNCTGLPCPVKNSCELARIAVSKLPDEDVQACYRLLEKEIAGLSYE